MRNRYVYPVVMLLTFFLGTGITSLQPIKIHSSENNSPYSVLEGTTVRIKPYDATFEIPEGWLTPEHVPASAKNLHLSWLDLNRLYWNDGGDVEDAQVINSVLPFEDCAAHVGDRDWGNHFWGDLQARVYVVDFTPEQVARRIEERGVDTALDVFEGAELSWEKQGEWQKSTLHILDAPTHFSLMKSLDFYYRRFGTKTVVFVFLHAGDFDPTIRGMLDSFKPYNGLECISFLDPPRHTDHAPTL